jgi:glycosyltransferase involved in cell wall biosynthesis
VPRRAGLSIAVAMASYQGARFISDQLSTILRQSLTPKELVVSDDGSTDDTVEIAQSVIPGARERGIAMRVISHRGDRAVASNFHYAVSQTSAELVALADQDDFWLEGKLQALSAHFVGNPNLLMVHSDAELVDESGALIGIRVLDSLRITRAERSNLLTGQGIRALVRRNLVTGSTAMVRRELLELAGPIPEGWLHDEWWALVAASRGGLVLDPGVYQYYRQHSANQVGASKSGWQRLVQRFAEPQEEFRARHRIRHRGLEAFVESPSWSGSPEARQLLRGRLRHYTWQATLPASRPARLGHIARELLAGGYHRYRRGMFDALRDLFQPAP